MQFLFLLPIAVFLGLPAGMFLAWIAKEELKPGARYILLFSKALFFAIALLSLFFLFRNSQPYIGVIAVTAGIVIAVALNIFSAMAKTRFNYDYLFLGLVLCSGMAVLSVNALIALASCLLLCGLPFASLENTKKKIWKRLLFNAVLFFAPLLFLLLGPISVVGFGASAIYLLLRMR
ncbi:MAG TPA: hypothetical protein HA362_06390 [Nanoarchaeota archaeon]|nr:hypothetical protein [Nanoarchaeota archaeon]